MTSPSVTSSETPINRNDEVAVFALTRKGAELAARICGVLPGAACFCNERYALPGMVPMHKMADSFKSAWHRCGSIVCIMGCGIAVRMLAPLLDDKMVDPGVVVVDEKGDYAISLVSGHLGGANELARKVAAITGGQAVITTASDLEDKTAIDLTVRKAGLVVENRVMLSRVAAAVLDEEPLWIFDPQRLFVKHLPETHGFRILAEKADVDTRLRSCLGIWVSETLPPSGARCLKLRPLSLVVGIGCNRGTEAEEIGALVECVFKENGLSPVSIRNFATVDIKRDEPGLLMAASAFKKPVRFFSCEELAGVRVPNPSAAVARHIGVESVCEASALWSAQASRLLVTKRKSQNCTLAVARAVFS